MPRTSLIELETLVAAPPARCFDLSLSVEVHLDSAAGTSERVVAGVSSGILGPGDEITWEAHHLGLRHRLAMKISAYDRPRSFQDEMVRGPFRHLSHVHVFEPVGDGTRMIDRFEVSSRVAWFDRLVLVPHLRRFLERRNDFIRRLAESGDWQRYLD